MAPPKSRPGSAPANERGVRAFAIIPKDANAQPIPSLRKHFVELSTSLESERQPSFPKRGPQTFSNQSSDQPIPLHLLPSVRREQS